MADKFTQATFSEKTFSNILRADGTYLIIGGTGGIGRSITRWMFNKGAKNIVLVSRSASPSAKVKELIEEGKTQGINVCIHACDVSDQERVQAMVAELGKSLPPIRGMIHSAMVLDVRRSSLKHRKLLATNAVIGCPVRENDL